MAHRNEQKIKGDRVSSSSTKSREERHRRRNADPAGLERGATPGSPDKTGLAPAQDNTRDPRPFPSQQHKSGPERKF